LCVITDMGGHQRAGRLADGGRCGHGIQSAARPSQLPGRFRIRPVISG
jgi:hypothetical protein